MFRVNGQRAAGNRNRPGFVRFQRFHPADWMRRHAYLAELILRVVVRRYFPVP
ncbi:hypothetical protein LCGC14_1934040, partial [marine sediment metagenome]